MKGCNVANKASKVLPLMYCIGQTAMTIDVFIMDVIF